MTQDLSPFVVSPEQSLRDVMTCIDRNAKGIALVADAAGRLLGTVTDGDVRRALLDHVDLDAPARALLERKALEPFPTPVTAPIGTEPAHLIELMNAHSLRHVPLLDDEGRLAGLAVLNDLVREFELPLKAVVMAGGFGTRLYPLTAETPKPMLPVGGRPVLEHVIDQLRTCGIRHINVTTHHLAESISSHFGDGSAFGVDIEYVNEDQPLGTAGALALLEESDEPLLVINGDILTRVDYRTMLDFHREHLAAMTVAVRREEVQIPFGVVHADGVAIRSIEEKPIVAHFINAGIYLLDPSVRRHVADATRLDMPELVARVVSAGDAVVAFPVREYWLDVGHPTSYEQAEQDAGAGRLAP
jgi:dTDP-glucose pyrophosphorylase/CBS domain-containing protein